MKIELVDCHIQEEKEFWSRLPKSVTQRVLHNILVREIFQNRDNVENVTAESLHEYKERIKALKYLLGIIHRTDEPPTK